MSRFAAIDVGTNSVLLLVAERQADGRFVALEERSEITRLGRGVDSTKALSTEAIEATLVVLTRFAREARARGAQSIVTTATSAARDATNGQDFLDGARARAGLEIEILTGEEEARLSFASAFSDFGGQGPLVVVDIGGGSTEFIYGGPLGELTYRHSFDVGSVRLTERSLKSDPPSEAELAEIDALLTKTFSALPKPPPAFRMVGVAGTVTTMCAVSRRVEPYDAALVHGATLSLQEVKASLDRLASLPLSLRRTVPGLQPKRADVIVTGGLLLQAAMRSLGAAVVTVSDRGLRWGVLIDRFRSTA